MPLQVIDRTLMATFEHEQAEIQALLLGPDASNRQAKMTKFQLYVPISDSSSSRSSHFFNITNLAQQSEDVFFIFSKSDVQLKQFTQQAPTPRNVTSGKKVVIPAQQSVNFKATFKKNVQSAFTIKDTTGHLHNVTYHFYESKGSLQLRPASPGEAGLETGINALHVQSTFETQMRIKNVTCDHPELVQIRKVADKISPLQQIKLAEFWFERRTGSAKIGEKNIIQQINALASRKRFITFSVQLVSQSRIRTVTLKKTLSLIDKQEIDFGNS